MRAHELAHGRDEPRDLLNKWHGVEAGHHEVPGRIPVTDRSKSAKCRAFSGAVVADEGNGLPLRGAPGPLGRMRVRGPNRSTYAALPLQHRGLPSPRWVRGMVEAGGIEPPSQSRQLRTSTRVFRDQGLAPRPPTDRWPSAPAPVKSRRLAPGRSLATSPLLTSSRGRGHSPRGRLPENQAARAKLLAV